MKLNLCILVAACCLNLNAALKPAGIFGDNMVIQRDVEVPVWGWAEKGEKITLEINGFSKTIHAFDNGKWLFKIGPFQAGGPLSMKITGEKSGSVTFKNILIGEVWLCGGQSNMQWGVGKMENGEKEVATANYPQIRLTTITGTSKEPKNDLTCIWQECSPKTVGNFSAPGYFFGRELHKELNVPIGLIMNAEGSSPIRSWIGAGMQNSNPVFKKALEDYKTYAERKTAYDAVRKAYNEALEKSKKEGTPPPAFPGSFEAYGDTPGFLYNARVVPLALFAIKGVIWYQGENEALYKNAKEYDAFLSALIEDWRKLWGQGNFPFIYVQLQPFGGKTQIPVESDWAQVRDGQRRALKEPDTAMIVTTDICDAALHPLKKVELGKRLALAALALAYGHKGVIYSGPLFDNIVFKEGKAHITFSSAAGSLVCKGTKLEGFTIAGDDKKFFNAYAKIENERVIVSSDNVKDPKAVRYNWSGNPSGNLFNKEGQPTSCFRTDAW